MHQVLLVSYYLIVMLTSLSCAGNVYTTDRDNYRIRKITVSTGIITTIAGTGTASYSGDNAAATSAALNQPSGITLDSAGTLLSDVCILCVTDSLLLLGNVYIADTYNHRIRKVTVSTGIITTIAGNGGGTFSGDNGLATSAGLYYPNGIALDSSGASFYWLSALVLA